LLGSWILSGHSSGRGFADTRIFGVINRRLGRRALCGCGTIVDMRQLQLFTSAALAEMRDRTASRNYSPEREEFRREHARHRAWGLLQRHGERLRRQRRQSCAHAPAPRGEGVAAAVTPPAQKSRPTMPSRATATATPRPRDRPRRPDRHRRECRRVRQQHRCPSDAPRPSDLGRSGYPTHRNAVTDHHPRYGRGMWPSCRDDLPPAGQIGRRKETDKREPAPISCIFAHHRLQLPVSVSAHLRRG
jgi:hypothetical protein